MSIKAIFRPLKNVQDAFDGISEFLKFFFIQIINNMFLLKLSKNTYKIYIASLSTLKLINTLLNTQLYLLRFLIPM
jgi:hypothetical protein